MDMLLIKTLGGLFCISDMDLLETRSIQSSIMISMDSNNLVYNHVEHYEFRGPKTYGDREGSPWGPGPV